ncbi:MAG: metallophosphoesterase [Thermoleophilaceae bacterium]
MRALAISDLHFGAWTGDPVLSREFARERLAPLLDDVDELVLLGDVFDFLFSSIDHAVAQGDPFFELVQRRLQGKRVVFLAGNHDHHVVVRALRSLVETKVATGAEGEELARIFEAEYRDFFQRFLDRRLDGVDCRMVYPTHMIGDVLLCHGHYLDAHVGGSVPNRLLTRGEWAVAGGRPADDLRIEDYEAVIVPLTELLFTVAQLPRGCSAQEAFLHQFERIGKLLRLGALVERQVKRAGASISARRGRRPSDGGGGIAATAAEISRGDRPPARASAPSAPVPLALDAYRQVVRNLGWDRISDKLVFAHTHQPLDGATADADDGVRFWNTGSWIYEPSLGSIDSYLGYLRRAWPGTAVLVDTDASEPQLIELLRDQNPLHGATTGTGDFRAGVADQFSARARAYDAKLPAGAGASAARGQR